MNSGRLPLATTEPGLEPLLQATLGAGRFRALVDDAALAGREIAIVAVDTPIDVRHRPDARQLERACRTLADRVTRPCVVVIESTVAPRTLRDLIAPIFGEGVFLIHCPERVRPGRLLRNLRGMARLVGASDPKVAALGTELYRNIVHADLVVTDWETAEVIKSAENATRDVQIALANQLALICDYVGGNCVLGFARTISENERQMLRPSVKVFNANGGLGADVLRALLPCRATCAGRTIGDSTPACKARGGPALPESVELIFR